MSNSDVPNDRRRENCSTRRVVMFHIGRSGSTVLGDLLNQHRSIRWDGEIYRELFAKFGGQMKDMRISDKAVAILGIESENPSIRLSRTTPFNLAEVISNYAEVERALCGIRYEWMLYE